MKTTSNFFMTPEETAAYLGISKITVYNYIKSKKILAFKLGNSRWRIPIDEINRITSLQNNGT
ncbi:MAG: helix-turn-helix domain-containing protein [Oscillospiraceae bacterium]|nr:helix-turn-helix domain-containing protein [Oscillospiraceae bacterium]